jgi:sugar-specific transcriptional regulator TrmB
MIASNKVLDALRNIGLNLYERKLWVALLARGTATAGELSTLSQVPRSRTYDVLQSLAEKGFVIIQTGKPIKFVAVPPEEALERYKSKLLEKFKVMESRVEELKNSPTMRELMEIHQKGMKMISPEDITGALKGKFTVLQQIGSMLKQAKEKINIVTTPEGLNDLMKHHLEFLKKAREKGVDIKIVTTAHEKADDAIKVLSSIADIRYADEKEIPISGRFTIVDGKQLVFHLTDSKVHSTQDMALWTKSEHAAGNVLEPLFKLIWEHSKPLN